MRKSTILLLVLSINLSQQIDTADSCAAKNEYFYNYVCITPECYEHMDVLTKSGAPGSQIGKINPSLRSEVELIKGEMHIHIYQQEDDINDPLESDGCIQVEIWQRLGSSTGDPNLVIYKDKKWPEFYEKKFDSGASDMVRSFKITPDDLQKCEVSVQDNDDKIYYCYFVLLFTLKGVVQAEYYFHTELTVLGTAPNSIFGFDFSKFQEVKKSAIACANENGQTECVEVVETELQFCEDQDCNKIIEPKAIILNEFFYVIHRITEKAFSRWKLEVRSDGVYYNGAGLAVPGKVENVKETTTGGLIYKLKASATYEDVSVSITSTLRDPKGNRLLVEDDDKFSTGTTSKFSTCKEGECDKNEDGNGEYLLGILSIVMVALLA